MKRTPYKPALVAALVVLVSGFSTGCDSEAVAAGNISHDRSHAVRNAACTEVVVPHGFALGWDRFNHRLSRWGVELDHDDCAAKQVNITHVGGVFSTNPVLSDTPWARFHYQRARSGDDVAIARISLRDVVLADGRTEGSVDFDLEELGLDDRKHYVALIEGLHYDTSIQQGPDYPALYNPGRGYTTRGLGAEVDVERIGENARVSYVVHFETGPSPERLFMNRTLPFARVGTRLDVLIVGTDGPANRGDVAYTMQHERPLPFADPKLPAAEERLRSVAVAGSPAAPAGFYGLSKFHFDLELEDECRTGDDCTFGTCGEAGRCVYGPKRLGEYIREFAVGVRLHDFDQATGEARFVFDGYTSNASSFLAYYPLKYTFTGGVAWVQAGEADGPLSLEEGFETGEASFMLQ